MNLGILPEDKALGVKKDIQENTLRFNIKMNDKQATWWGLLEALSNVYDPFDLGVLFLFQRLC